jgi:probable F420-dependent oxidoreductase
MASDAASSRPAVAHRVGLGRLGVWTPVRLWVDAGQRAADVGAELEELGYGAIWLGNGTETFDVASSLLEATRRIGVATGIVNIKYHPVEPTLARFTELTSRHPGRILLGLGGSWGRVAGPGSTTWYEKMLDYLDALDGAPTPVPSESRVLAANGPRMLRLARCRSAGAHPFLTTPAHTHQARKTLGDGPLLAPEQKVLLETSRSRAREIARQHLGFYLTKANYARVLLGSGFTEEDLVAGGSDRLVDSLVAWGDVDDVRVRIEEHIQAGADHVAIQPLNTRNVARSGFSGLPREEYRQLAKGLASAG